MAQRRRATGEAAASAAPGDDLPSVDPLSDNQRATLANIDAAEARNKHDTAETASDSRASLAKLRAVAKLKTIAQRRRDTAQATTAPAPGNTVSSVDPLSDSQRAAFANVDAAEARNKCATAETAPESRASLAKLRAVARLKTMAQRRRATGEAAASAAPGDDLQSVDPLSDNQRAALANMGANEVQRRRPKAKTSRARPGTVFSKRRRASLSEMQEKIRKDEIMLREKLGREKIRAASARWASEREDISQGARASSALETDAILHGLRATPISALDAGVQGCFITDFTSRGSIDARTRHYRA